MEEVARLSGYDTIPTTFPPMPAEGRSPDVFLEFRNRLKGLMNGFGFSEAITYSFASELSADRLRLKKDDSRRALLPILNPLTEDQAVMRTSLVPCLIEAAVYNIAQQVKNLKIFEIGRIFINSDPKGLPQEPEMLTALWTGTRNEATWHHREIPCDFYDMKGAAEGMIHALKINDVRFTQMPEESCNYTRPGHTANIVAGDVQVGIVGELHPQVCENFDLKQKTYIFELELDKIVPLIPQNLQYKAIPKFPAIYRDITIIVDRGIETQSVMETVEKSREELVERLYLFDIFEGDPIPAGKKSISFRVTYRSPDKTLVDDEVSELHKSITDNLLKAFDGSLPV